MKRAPGALDGLRVLDLADASGAYCGRLLADLGADVVAVEPVAGSAMRRCGPFYGGVIQPSGSLFFWHFSTNKRSIALDLQRAADRSRLLELSARSDILVETESPGTLDRLGLGYPVLAARNPRLIMVSITPSGQTAGTRHRRTCDLTAQAAGGMAHVNGFPGQAPLQGVGLPAYHSAGLHGAIGALLALLAREVTQRGQWIDVSLLESATACVEHAGALHDEEGRVAQRQGSLHWSGDFRVGRCADGDLLHCTLGDWRSLLEWIKADGKAQDLVDPAWEDVAHRRAHCRHLFDVLDQWTAPQRQAEVVEAAQLRRLAYAAVRPPEALKDDAQLQARQFFVSVHHDELGVDLIHPGAPYVLSRTPWAIRRRPPLTGEHSEEVLRQWRTTGGREAATAPAMGGALQRPAGPLTGCRIADFSWMVAGPLTTRILADFGAEVIKIEAPRRRPNTNPPAGLFGALNRGKRSIAVDMTTSAGVALAKRLIAASDVVVDNFSARVLQNWGLDDVTLHHLNPQLVRLRMSGFGLTGPYRDRVSYGPTLQALCGHTWLMRGETGAIAGWGFSYADMVAGLSGAFAVLAALWYRRSSGVGQQIDLSQFENLATLLGPRFLDILVNGSPWPPIGNHSQELAAAPHGIYRCADRPGSGPARDRWCALAVFGDDDWLRFRRAVGEPAWSYDPRFAHHADRWHNRAQLDARVEEWTRGRRAETVAACLQDAGLAAAVVADAEDLRRRDPQLGAPGYWVCRGAREGKEAAVDGTPLRLFQTQPRLRTGAPFSGEHTDVLLRQILGLTAAEVTALHAERVVA